MTLAGYIFLAILFVFFILGIVSYFRSNSKKTKDYLKEVGRDRTLQKISAIKMGLSCEEVVSVLGSAGIATSGNGDTGTYAWFFNEGQSVIVSFVGGKVTSIEPKGF